MRKLLLFILILSVSTAFGQMYSVSTPFKSINKTTSHGILHEFIQIDNLIGTDFDMRWIAFVGGKSGCPSNWDLGVNDPDSAYQTLNNLDSADFTLSGTNWVNNKIVISVNHNGDTGTCNINFQIFPLSDPSASTMIGFDVTVTEAVGVGEIMNIEKVNIYPVPTNEIVKIDNLKEDIIKIDVLNTVGEVLHTIHKPKQVSLDKLKAGIYFLRIETSNGILTKRVVKN